MRKTLLIIALGLVCSIAAQAAPIQQGLRVYQLVAQLHTTLPSDWHFIILNEGQWQVGVNQNGAPYARSAVSDLKSHLTYVREGYVERANDYELRRSLAHEIGHFQCQCQSEDKADHYRDQILKSGSR